MSLANRQLATAPMVAVTVRQTDVVLGAKEWPTDAGYGAHLPSARVSDIRHLSGYVAPRTVDTGNQEASPRTRVAASATACSQSRSVAGRGVADHAGKPIGHPGTARDLADVLDLHAVRACWLLQQI